MLKKIAIITASIIINTSTQGAEPYGINGDTYYKLHLRKPENLFLMSKEEFNTQFSDLIETSYRQSIFGKELNHWEKIEVEKHRNLAYRATTSILDLLLSSNAEDDKKVFIDDFLLRAICIPNIIALSCSLDTILFVLKNKDKI